MTTTTTNLWPSKARATLMMMSLQEHHRCEAESGNQRQEMKLAWH
jgi:hypothetical protein